jgi:hypothetical protein
MLPGYYAKFTKKKNTVDSKINPHGDKARGTRTNFLGKETILPLVKPLLQNERGSGALDGALWASCRKLSYLDKGNLELEVATSRSRDGHIKETARLHADWRRIRLEY